MSVSVSSLSPQVRFECFFSHSSTHKSQRICWGECSIKTITNEERKNIKIFRRLRLGFNFSPERDKVAFQSLFSKNISRSLLLFSAVIFYAFSRWDHVTTGRMSEKCADVEKECHEIKLNQLRLSMSLILYAFSISLFHRKSEGEKSKIPFTLMSADSHSQIQLTLVLWPPIDFPLGSIIFYNMRWKQSYHEHLKSVFLSRKKVRYGLGLTSISIFFKYILFLKVIQGLTCFSCKRGVHFYF